MTAKKSYDRYELFLIDFASVCFLAKHGCGKTSTVYSH